MSENQELDLVPSSHSKHNDTDNGHTCIICDRIATFYPNECAVCHISSPLKRCSQCNMVTYCGEAHQRQHWNKHKAICKVISKILKEKKITHIYENFRGLNSAGWMKAKIEVLSDVRKRLKRDLLRFEGEMFRFPRACFLCHDSRQDFLTNCLGCTNASFCKEHPSSSIHDIDCSQIQEGRRIDINPLIMTKARMQRMSKSIAESTPISKDKNRQLPTTMQEFFDYIKLPTKLCSEIIESQITELLCGPLTVFKALKKLNQFQSMSTLVLHVQGFENEYEDAKMWEILLHLIPSLKNLRIIFLGHDKFKKLDCKLCNKCRESKKKLSIQVSDLLHVEYVESDNYEEPGLAFLANSETPTESEMQQRFWKQMLISWGTVNCPLVISTHTEDYCKTFRENLDSTFNEILYFYDGRNDFAPLRPHRFWETERVFRRNEFIMIIKIIREETPLKCTSCGVVCQTVDSKTSHCINCESDLQCTDAALFPKQSGNLSRSFFYVNCCQVCNHRHYNSSGKSLPVVPCSHCKMSFYCHETHRKSHWAKHKDLCNAILAIKSEFGSPDIFEKVDKSSPEAWTQAKIDLILKAESKLGRKLLDNEREMFLFPKTCFACHESNSNLLTSCKCGIFLCETHEDFPEHKDLCKDLHLTFGLDSYFLSTRQRAAPIADKELFLGSTKSMIFKAISSKKKSRQLPSSMKAFVETYFQAWEENDWEIVKPIKTSYWKQFIYTDIFSRPLTLLFAMEKFEWSFESMVVHVIGATDDEKSEAGYWEILLHFVPNFKSLKLVYVGPENSDLKLVKIKVCGDCLKEEKSLEIEGFRLRYDEYFESDFFVKPDIIVGFNLEMHESEYGIMECTWKDTVLTLRKVKAPFIITSGSELRAEKDFRKLETLLGESVQHFIEKNPFGSLISERDFETERFKFANHFIVVYTGLYRESERGETFSETKSDEALGLLETRTIYEDLESEREATDEDSESKMKEIVETSESKLESIVSTLETLSFEEESEKLEENLELLEKIKQSKGSSYSIKDGLDYDENRIITSVRKNSL